MSQAASKILPVARRMRPSSRLVLSAGVSAIGDGLADIALALLAVRATDDARLIVGVYIAAKLPWLLLGNPLSRFSDRRSRPARVMVASDAARMLVVAVASILVAGGHGSIPVLYAVAFLLGSGEVLHTAAGNSLLPDIASGPELARANGYMGAAQLGGYAMAGPAVAGLVYSAGQGLPFIVDAITFGLSAALLIPLVEVRVRRPEAVEGGRAAGHVRFVLRHPLLRLLLLQLVVVGLAQAMVISSLPILGQRRLGLGEVMYGVFMGATSVGNVVGGILGPRLWARRQHTATLVLGSGTAMGIAYVLASRTLNPVAAGAFLAVEATAVGILNTVSPTLRMEHAPADARGRVSTLFTQSIFISLPIGAVASGLLVDRYGIEVPLALAGSITIATMLLTDRSLRRAVSAARA